MKANIDKDQSMLYGLSLSITFLLFGLSTTLQAQTITFGPHRIETITHQAVNHATVTMAIGQEQPTYPDATRPTGYGIMLIWRRLLRPTNPLTGAPGTEGNPTAVEYRLKLEAQHGGAGDKAEFFVTREPGDYNDDTMPQILVPITGARVAYEADRIQIKATLGPPPHLIPQHQAGTHLHPGDLAIIEFELANHN